MNSLPNHPPPFSPSALPPVPSFLETTIMRYKLRSDRRKTKRWIENENMICLELNWLWQAEHSLLITLHLYHQLSDLSSALHKHEQTTSYPRGTCNNRANHSIKFFGKNRSPKSKYRNFYRQKPVAHRRKTKIHKLYAEVGRNRESIVNNKNN